MKIAEVTLSENAVIRGEVLKLSVRPIKQRPIFEIVVGDETGTIHAVWFNQIYLKDEFQVGAKVILSGRVDLYQKRLQMNSPEYEVVEHEEDSPLHAGRITPIYPLTEGLFQRSLRKTMKELIEGLGEKEVQDLIPPLVRKAQNLLPLAEAIREIHFPSSFEKLEEARQRIVFDEFFVFEIELLYRLRLLREKKSGFVISADDSLLAEFKKTLPFSLTSDQEKTIREIEHDIKQTFPMNRLLQGEVGSGKTLVAAFALFLAVRAEYQAAFLVPTEILAEQHGQTFEKVLRRLGVVTTILTASTGAEKRIEILRDLREGKPGVLIGTHAILQEKVQFRSLALVVIDEQHKFGVRQRSHLLQTSPRPHQLVMTATPIPRTLALILYGDLSVSTVKELPAGRSPVKTYWIVRKKQSEILRHIREEVSRGGQAYFVFPTIEETEKADLFAAKEEYERLRKEEFSGLKLGLVHGRLVREEREKIMSEFQEGKTQVLVATSVIEVGVDNPNATIIVIENAERFGLSQLHQLRGRVGRGGRESECFLFGEPKTEEGKRRLRVLTKTNDGFLIAEEDLRLRGPGELLGTRQAGDPLFKVADLNRDFAILLLARQTATKVLEEDPHLSSAVWEKLRGELPL